MHKKGARNLVSNHSPVGLTSIFYKMMESLIKDHVMNNLTTHKLISPYQFDFIPGRSCTTLLLHVLDYITKHLDSTYSVEMIYLDFQKAFDSVPHQHLIHKLYIFNWYARKYTQVDK